MFQSSMTQKMFHLNRVLINFLSKLAKSFRLVKKPSKLDRQGRPKDSKPLKGFKLREHVDKKRTNNTNSSWFQILKEKSILIIFLRNIISLGIILLRMVR